MEIESVVRSFGIGAATGLRSMTGPAAARWRIGDPLRLVFAALAAGELIADKLPATPNRTIAPALIFRILAGAWAADTLVRTASPGDRLAGGIAAGLGAIAGAFAGMTLRRAIVKVSRLPDPVIALAEDALAIGGAVALSRR